MTNPMTFEEMRTRMRTAPGFIAALDQSGGSTPKALSDYGISQDAYTDASGKQSDGEMFALMHNMRARIMKSAAFTKEKILSAILFRKTAESEIDGMPTPEFLSRRGIVPLVKVDEGLKEQLDGVQLMKDMPALDGLLKQSKGQGIFGTKMRSVIHEANEKGIAAVVKQQFQFAEQIIAAGLVPIIEPEVSIKCPDKPKAEEVLRAELAAALTNMAAGKEVMFKLTIPTVDNCYQEFIDDPKVLRVVALSGGYSLDEACNRLMMNKGIIASFSRALLNDLRVGQSQDEFDRILGAVIEKIYRASVK